MTSPNSIIRSEYAWRHLLGRGHGNAELNAPFRGFGKDRHTFGGTEYLSESAFKILSWISTIVDKR
jgi:hypothetical protein